MEKCYFLAYDDASMLLLTCHLRKMLNARREILLDMKNNAFLSLKGLVCFFLPCSLVSFGIIWTQNGQFILNDLTMWGGRRFCN